MVRLRLGMINLMKRRAFTLIELLVVIVVIGILAAILLPALARSKAVAKGIHCVGNVRQLALTAHLYADDNQDRLPSDRMPLDDHSFVAGHWDSTFFSGYLDRNKEVFQCAVNRLPNPPPYGVNPNRFNLSYGWNRYGLNDDGKERSVKLGSVVSPSDCVTLGDTSGWDLSPNIIGQIISDVAHRDFEIFFVDVRFHPPLFSPVPSLLDSRYTFHLTRRHYGHANIAFLDGHVEHGDLRELTLPVESVHRRWHYDNKAHLDRLVYRDVDNWAPLRGMDEELPEDD